LLKPDRIYDNSIFTKLALTVDAPNSSAAVIDNGFITVNKDSGDSYPIFAKEELLNGQFF
jgi:hypothetical protein